MSVQIQLRRDLEANWFSVDPILADGELALSTDVSNLKVGNGSDIWSDLPYLFTGPVSWGDIVGLLSDQTDLVSALAGKVPVTRTVNSHALSGDVTVSKSDVGLGSVDDVQQLPLSYLDTDVDLAGNSDTKVPSQKAVKTYIDFNGDEDINAYQALGSTIKAQALSLDALTLSTNGANLTDGLAVFVAVWVPKKMTVTGVKWYQVTQGNYTADQNNYLALYSYSGGTLTRVAISTNNGNLWKATANTVASEPFSSPYDILTPGLYFIGILYNNSAQVTAPSIATGLGTLANVAHNNLDFTNSAKVQSQLAAQNSLPTPQVMSALTGRTVYFWFALY